ncbi:hypothetical protein BGX23_006085 [Mortierella sp. AD031]|nr:hypothetical protein BGX23_006085 [Mortierella sp. AD031]
MGSQPSKQETAIEACLADFPDHERTYVLALFEKLCKGVVPTDPNTSPQDAPTQKGGHRDNHQQDTIDPVQFNAYFNPLLPPILLTCFRVTMQMHSAIHEVNDNNTSQGNNNAAAPNNNRASRRQGLTRSTSVDSTSRISKYGWVMTIHRLCKTSIEEQAGLSFMLQTHDKSLESFVANVTRAVMAFWLAGEVGSWRDIPEGDVEGTTGFLLTRHLKSAGKNGFESDDEGEEQVAGVGGLDKAGQDWLETATKRDGQGQSSTRELSRSAFLNWYQQTVEYQIMFTILIQNLFLGQSTLPGHDINNTGTTAAAGTGKRIKLPAEVENKLCQKNYIAPRIKGGIEAAPHYSRLLSVADLFQLRYALPTPVYNMAASTGSAKKGSSGGGGGGLEQDLSETRPTPPLRLLFSSKTSGASFSTLLQKITYQGPTLVVMKDEDGYIFGAYADQDWEQGPKFYGTDRSFLFTIRPTFRIFRPSHGGVNSNFQYLDSGTKTLPNGIGFGGQLRYFGLWLASDFHTGHSAAEPLCSTFQSPRLSKQQNFKLDEMEVWQVHPSTIERDDLPKHSAMDAHPDAVALLEMANRKMYSKDVRAPENVYDSD